MTNDDGTIASRRHTGVLCAILIAVAAAGYWGSLHAGRGPSGAALYLPLIAAEWGLFLYARAGLKRHGIAAARIVSERELTARTVATDLLLGAVLFAAMLALEALLDRLMGGATPAGAKALLVRRAGDIPLWIALSASAGFVEEFVFRGYLQRQFGAWLGGALPGIAAQAILFGVTHGYQGAASVARIAILGLAFGIAARARHSLVPGMTAHAAMDIAGGLALFR